MFNKKKTADLPYLIHTTIPTPISKNLADNEKQIRSILGNSPDVEIRKFAISIKNGNPLDALTLVLGGMVDESAVRGKVLEPLMTQPLKLTDEDSLEPFKQRLYIKKLNEESDLMQGILSVLTGGTLVLIQGYSRGIVVLAEGFEVRPMEEPPSEAVVRGSREGFVESAATNISLLRRRIYHPSLRFELFRPGEVDKSEVIIAYVQGIADPALVQRVRERLEQIKVDSMSCSGEIEQFIEDHPFTLFPTIGNTERPDKAAALLMEGRVIIFKDGDPIVLFVPHLFVEAFQNMEDYSSRPYYVSFIRLVRVVSFFISIALPSVFIAAINFHKETIPSELIVSMAQAREKVPFPLVMELSIMLILFEIVREAGVRMPRPIGQAVSIVGALILGQVSVQAGLVGAPTIIIVAFSAISAFIITPIADVAGVLRLALVIPTSVFGMYGFLMSMLGILTHMISLTSLGVPYLAPFSPLYFRDWKDALLRFPLQWHRKRPMSIPNLRSRRIHQLPGDREKRQ